MKKSFITQDIQILLINNDNKNEILKQITQGRILMVKKDQINTIFLLIILKNIQLK